MDKRPGPKPMPREDRKTELVAVMFSTKERAKIERRRPKSESLSSWARRVLLEAAS